MVQTDRTPGGSRPKDASIVILVGIFGKVKLGNKTALTIHFVLLGVQLQRTLCCMFLEDPNKVCKMSSIFTRHERS
jgi:hypothetical protein